MKMRKPRILVVGSLVMDLITEASRFPVAGETVLGTSFSTAPGGKGANQAVQAARLQADVTMIGMIGSDLFGDEMLASLCTSGVNIEHIIRSTKASSGVGNIQIEKNGFHVQNRIVVIPGANMCIKPADLAFLKDEIATYNMILLQFEIPMEINIMIASWAVNKGIPVMLNCAPFTSIPSALLKNITYISPNETEAEALTGIKVKDDESIKRAIQAIKNMGVPHVIITLGSRGAVYGDDEKLIFSSALENLNVKDTTAAGDSFIGAFCTAIAMGLSIESSLKFANYTAAITVCRKGAQPSLPNLQEVFEFMKKRGFSIPEIM